MNHLHIAEWPCCVILPPREDMGTTSSPSYVLFAGSGEAIPSDSF